MSHYPDWQRQGDGLVFRGTHYLVVSRKRDGMKAVRSLMDEVCTRIIDPNQRALVAVLYVVC